MNNSIARHLRKVVHTCDDWSDFSNRVVKAYGPSYLPFAELIAREVKGGKWFVEEYSEDSLLEEERVHAEYAPMVREIPTQERVDDEKKGNEYMNSNITPNPLAFPLGFASLFVLKVIVVLMLAAIAYPPFHITIQGNIDINQGFKFIGSVSSPNDYVGVVTTSLLLCEILVILIVGIASFILARHWEKHGSV
jgi:hypothetical protein